MAVKRKRPLRGKSVSRSSKRSSTSKKSKRTGGFDRGAAGFEKGKNIRERQDKEYELKKDTPWNFRLKPGEEADIIVTDKDEPFFVTLHSVKVSGNKWETVVCIADHGENCPICADTGKEGSFTLMLTCLDKRVWKDRAGKTHRINKRLLPVKGRNLAKFQRAYEKHGSFRGLKITCRRDGDKESAIGEDLSFNGKMGEKSLKKFGKNAIPADYEKIFAIPSADDLRKRFRLGSGPAGSEEFAGDDDDAEMEGWD